MNKNEAIAAIITRYDDPSRAADAIIDYADDPAIESNPDFIDAFDSLGDDITEMLETITPLAPALAAMIAERAELCPQCFADLEICDC